VLAQITWYHNLAILEKLTPPEIAFVPRRPSNTVGAVNLLVHQIETGRVQRKGNRLPTSGAPCLHLNPPRAGNHERSLQLRFSLGDDARERDPERDILGHLQPAGRKPDFFIDLLFYHLKLRAYVVIDLEMKAFEPEFAGEMNSISQPSMTACGIPMINPASASVFARHNERIVAEYALRDFNLTAGQLVDH
jgi:hypothetical protein